MQKQNNPRYFLLPARPRYIFHHRSSLIPYHTHDPTTPPATPSDFTHKPVSRKGKECKKKKMQNLQKLLLNTAHDEKQNKTKKGQKRIRIRSRRIMG
jgi:hypothetical protein